VGSGTAGRLPPCNGGTIVAIAAERSTDTADPATGGSSRAGRVDRAGRAVIVGLVASPIVIAALALVGDAWVPLSDWASLVYRVSQVGGSDTPLVGPYSFHGFAHPGPLLYWIAAPLFRLTDGDPRSLLWTAAIVNTAAVVAIAAVAWRRGRWPLLVGTMVLVAALVHGIGPDRMADLWNPYIALLPFLLTLLLAWDAALGRPRALVEAVVPASFAMQSHLAFLTLVGLVAVWLVAWLRWSPRLLDVDGRGGEDADAPAASARSRAVLAGPNLRRAALLAGVLWLPPAVDALFDLHNPVDIVRSLISPDPTVGPVDGAAIVGSYIGPFGAWVRGNDTVLGLEVSLAHMLTLAPVLAMLTACFVVGRRRRLDDVAALVSLTALLVVGALLATSQLIDPPAPYLAEWLKVVGGLVWFALGWTAWQAAATSTPTSTARRGGAVLAGAALVCVVAWSWGPAAATTPPHEDNARLVHEIRAALRDQLADDVTYKVDVVGDPLGHHQGLFYWLIEDGYDVVTTDGALGLKWGHDHVHEVGDRVDRHLTVAVHYGNSFLTAYDDCSEDERVRPLFVHTTLDADERRWLQSVNLRRVSNDPVTPEEDARWRQLSELDYRIAIYEGDETCGAAPAED